MQQTIKINKQRAHRYQKLLKMIKGYKRTAEQQKMLDKIKIDTQFQINLRFRKCETNKSYRFPKAISFEQQLSDKQQQTLNGDICNLFDQNNSSQQIVRQKRLRLKKLDEIHQKVDTKKADNNYRVSSLGRNRNKQSKHRIDRIQKIQNEQVMEKAKISQLKTQRVVSEQSESNRKSIFDSRNSKKKSILRFEQDINRQEEIKSKKNSFVHSNHFKNLISIKKGNYDKTNSNSPAINSQDTKKKSKLRTQQTELFTIKKVVDKKLYTQQIQTIKPGKIQNFVSNEIKKSNHLNQITPGIKLKQKNLFHKAIF